MTRNKFRCLPIPIAIACALNAGLTNATVLNPVVLNDNAGWCWYQDERVIVHDNRLYFGSVASRIGTDGEARSGNIEVGVYNLDGTTSAKVHVMHSGLEDDDHNVPALLALPDDEILAVYSKHNTDRKVRSRIMDNRNAQPVWQKETAIKRKDKVTYANLMRLSDENNGAGRVYNFYRGINFNPTFDVSDDNGKSWSAGKHFIKNQGRPYVKYISNDKDTIHFVTTEQHPRVFDNSIYHGYIKAGQVFKSDGTFIQSLDDGPIDVTQLSKVFQGDKNKVAWTTDLHINGEGQPFTVFSVQVNDAGKNKWKGEKHGDDMRYYYAKWQEPSWWQFGQKARWQVNEIAYAGSRLYDKEQDYTGLAALNPQNENELVISTNADPVTGQPLMSDKDGKRHWELFIGRSDDSGNTFEWQPLTQNSISDNLRPVIPINRESDDLYLTWMRGKYVTYTDIDTQLVLSINPK